MSEESDLEQLRATLLARIGDATTTQQIVTAVDEVLAGDAKDLVARWVERTARGGTGHLTLGAGMAGPSGASGTGHLDLGAGASIDATVTVTAAAEVRAVALAPRVTGHFELEVNDPDDVVISLKEGLLIATLVPALQPWIDGLHQGPDSLVGTHALALALAILLVLGYRAAGGGDAPGA